VLDKQIEKLGVTPYDIVKKEHHDLALRKVSVGNSITSIKNISQINFTNVFERTNGVEEILRQDPIDVYDKMDFKTKNEYRNKIKDLSKSSMISEIYIASLALKCSKENLEKITDKKDTKLLKKCHIGYYLIDEGIKELKEKLEYKTTFKEKLFSRLAEGKSTLYIEGIITFTLFFTILLEWIVLKNIQNVFLTIFIGLFSIIPISELINEIIKYIFSKTLKPKVIPKLDYLNGIPKENATFVIIPTILKEKQKIKELFNNLESYYLGNKSENLYFALLRRL